MARIIAIYGSPRRNGNTARLLKQAVAGAFDAGAIVDEVVLRDLKMTPCLEIYQCQRTGKCAIKDDFHPVIEKMMQADALMLASPIFFYTVSAHTKILMDRCQSQWVKKYWGNNPPDSVPAKKRPGLFISAGATRGRKLFDGALLTVRYFFDAIDVTLSQSLLYRELDLEGDVLRRPEYIEEAYRAGKTLALALMPQQTMAATDS